jgi:hypothetical protein
VRGCPKTASAVDIAAGHGGSRRPDVGCNYIDGIPHGAETLHLPSGALRYEWGNVWNMSSPRVAVYHSTGYMRISDADSLALRVHRAKVLTNADRSPKRYVFGARLMEEKVSSRGSRASLTKGTLVRKRPIR